MTANLSGFGAAQKSAMVTLDATATVNIQMQLATTEAVTVTGETPLVDVTSTTTGTNYSAKIIDKLPVGRNYASIVLSQPGVQTDSGETQGRSLALSIYGTTSAENLFLIDGVNTTNVIKGFQGKNINTEFIQEVESRPAATRPSTVVIPAASSTSSPSREATSSTAMSSATTTRRISRPTRSSRRRLPARSRATPTRTSWEADPSPTTSTAARGVWTWAATP